MRYKDATVSLFSVSQVLHEDFIIPDQMVQQEAIKIAVDEMSQS